MEDKRLEKIKKFYKKFRRLPSYAEMLQLFDLSSKNSIYKLVKKWVEEGIFKKDQNKIVPSTKFFALPFLGIIKAGFPILAEENKSYLSIDEYLIDNPQSSFLLKVSGDSLSGIGIYEGDIVIIDKKRNAFPGEIVLAQIDREWTLKILRKDRVKQKIYLMAANPKYPPFYPKAELQIYGVVKAVIRKFN
jgi:repressor LexA